jgi:hypothetical protein
LRYPLSLWGMVTSITQNFPWLIGLGFGVPTGALI